MNREIKFKAIRKDGKAWVYGMPTYDFAYIFNDSQFDSPDNYEIIPETICQFTGLLDKNGKEIYEGDIVRQYFYNSSHLTRSKLFDVPVIYQENEFTFDVSIPNSEKFRTYTLFDLCVVVGNIHEGKETKGNGPKYIRQQHKLAVKFSNRK